jgi:type I restriction enzyme S subunit
MANLVRLGEVAGFERGLTYSKSDEVDLSDVVVLRANNVRLEDGQLDLTELRFLRSDFQVPKAKLVVANTLLVCTASGSKSHLGKVALVEEDLGFAFGGFMGRITPSKRVLPKFLFYCFRSHAYAMFIAALTDGANINNLTWRQLQEFALPVPPLEEQQRIVAKLDAVATLSSSLRDVSISQAKAAESLMFATRSEVFDGLEGTHLLGDVCEVLDRFRVPVTKRDRVSGNVPYYGATGVQDYVAEWIFNEPLVLVGEDGAKWGANEKSAFQISGPSWVNNHAHVLRPDRSRILDEWLCEWLCHSDLAAFISGVTVPKLNQERMRNIPVPVIPIREQQDLLSRLQQVREQSHELALCAARTTTEARDLEASVLAALLSGEVQ